MKKLFILTLVLLTSCNLKSVVNPEPTQAIEVVIPEPTPENTPEPVVLEPAIGAWADRDMFYYNGCSPYHKNTFTAQVNYLETVYEVTLHIRFVDKEGEGTTEWHTYVMNQHTNDDWSRTLVGNDLKSLIKNFEFMRMEYQVIAWSFPNIAALRTEVQSVSFEVCQE